MRRIAASLAAVLAAAVPIACGDGGAEPGAPEAGVGDSRELTLILDFQPNAVHSGIYAALAEGDLEERGIDLVVREPGASADAPKLLRSGRAELAILDIHDLAIAREAGFDLVGLAGVVQRPLAAVIAADRELVREPADLEGRRVGVTGLPSDDAVLESVLESGGLGLDDVEATTIGFEAVPALSAGRLAAATAFWNAEGVALRELGVPTRELRVEDFGAPRYPELVLVTTSEQLERDREPIEAAVEGLRDGYELAIEDPDAALERLLEAVPELDPETQRRQLEALEGSFEPALGLDRAALGQWADWDLEHGIVERRPDVEAAFDPL